MESRKLATVAQKSGARHNLSQSDIVVTRGLNRVAASSLRDVPEKIPASAYLVRRG